VIIVNMTLGKKRETREVRTKMGNSMCAIVWIKGKERKKKKESEPALQSLCIQEWKELKEWKEKRGGAREPVLCFHTTDLKFDKKEKRGREELVSNLL